MKADLILFNAFVEPVVGDTISNGAVAIKNGKIIGVGTTNEVLHQYKAGTTEVLDCKGNFLMPGFIEGHAHFSSLGYNLLNLDLLQTRSWQEIIDSVSARVRTAKPGSWIIGRGWHQEKWTSPVEPNTNGYPHHQELSLVSSEHPVMLTHASGHALLANQSAMEAAGISPETPDPEGGKIIRDHHQAVGVFEENAMEFIETAYKAYRSSLTKEEIEDEWYRAVSAANALCISLGITSFQDAGSTFDEISKYNDLALKDELDLRLWAMLREPLDSMKHHLHGFPILRTGKDRFTCRTIKAYIDGALGTFGAWLLEPYVERPGFSGQNVTPIEDINETAELCIQSGMQFAVHAIGDRGNRATLDIYAQTFDNHPGKKDLRWRIEHVQHLDPADIPRFKELEVIASMQAVHCTSDAPFVVKRLGYERAKSGAYAWRSLLDSGALIVNGTDAPVESVDPVPNFYASVTRKRTDSGEEFFPEQAMTRKEAIRSYTISNAYAAFEEDIKGSIEPGKWADLVLLSENLLTCPDEKILQTKVLMTIVGGGILYREPSIVSGQ